MSDSQAASEAPPLEAKSPYELRVNLGKNVPESDVRSALATGDMGFLHSFTTGSTVDGPGVRVVAWTAGCMWRCLYCHNPDTWTMSNGVPVTIDRATEELKCVAEGARPLPAEEVPLLACAGRVLAADVRSGVDVPGFPRAAMDGYAVRGEDTFGASDYDPLPLRLVGFDGSPVRAVLRSLGGR